MNTLRFPDAPKALTYTVNTRDMEAFGVREGSIFTAREARPGERPPDGSLVAAWINGDRYLLRLVGFTGAGRGCASDVTLENGRARKTFCACEVRFEAIAEPHTRPLCAPVVALSAWAGTRGVFAGKGADSEPPTEKGGAPAAPLPVRTRPVQLPRAEASRGRACDVTPGASHLTVIQHRVYFALIPPQFDELGRVAPS